MRIIKNIKYIFIKLMNIFIYRLIILYNILHRNTSTTLFDPRALEVLKDPKKFKELEQCIEEYHKTGKWDYDKINEITNN